MWVIAWAGIGVLLVALLRHRRRRVIDLGVVSEQWLREHVRASEPV
jgi:hypothetical protein